MTRIQLLSIICCCLLFCNLASAALPVGVQWEIRSTGSDSNGGGFVSGASGTDRSQADAAFCTATDLSVTTTSATSATCPFSAASVGNLIQITAGSCTAGFYQVVSVAVATATLDRSAGTASGCTFALGGGLLTLAKVITGTGPLVGGNTVWIKSGTYTLTTLLTVPTVTATTSATRFIGYNTTHGDNGTKPLITTATNSTHLFQWTSTTTPAYYFNNLSMSNTAGTRFDAFIANSNVTGLWIDNCKFDGFRHVVNADFAVVFEMPFLRVTNSEIKNGTSSQILNSGGGYYANNYFHDNSGDAINAGGAPTHSFVLEYNVFYKNTNGFHFNATSQVTFQFNNNDFSDQTAAGILFDSSTGPFALNIINNVFYANGTYGVNLGTTGNQPYNISNAYGANGTAATNNLAAGVGDVTLSADPFTARNSNNFALNSVAGGGAALKAVGYPGTFTTSLSAGVGYADIGAFQSQASSGGGNNASIQ